METIKEKIIVIIGIVLVIALCCGAYYMLVYQSSDYYTQIDNTKVEKISKHNMNYEYTLTSYNKNGKNVIICRKSKKREKFSLVSNLFYFSSHLLQHHQIFYLKKILITSYQKPHKYKVSFLV